MPQKSTGKARGWRQYETGPLQGGEGREGREGREGGGGPQHGERGDEEAAPQRGGLLGGRAAVAGAVPATMVGNMW